MLKYIPGEYFIKSDINLYLYLKFCCTHCLIIRPNQAHTVHMIYIGFAVEKNTDNLIWGNFRTTAEQTIYK